jgi:hypothetical protein
MSDIGTNALEKLFSDFLIDDEWSTREERAFSWIGHRLKQTVTAGKLFDDDGILLSRLTASTVIAREVKASEEDVFRHLARLNRHAIGSAYSYDPGEREISSTAIAYVHDETAAWRPQQFGVFTISQLCIAEGEADYIANKCDGSLAVEAHPTNGFRGVRDDMLSVLDATFARDGSGPSRYRDKFEFEAIAEMTKQTDKLASLGGSESGVAIEIPFGNFTSLAFVATDEPHRRAGSGLVVRLHLPTDATPDEADRISAVLNRAEHSGYSAATHYGAWCWDEWPNVGRAITYKLFGPNAIYRQGMSQDAAFSMAKRAIWVDGFLNAKHSSGSAWDILAERFGVSRGED